MFDGSSLPIEENIKKTKQVVEYAHAHNVTVEAEVGSVGGTEDGMTSNLMYADLDECLQIIQETGVDSLAPALGSVHGKYQGEPNLGFEEMEQLIDFTETACVLHGNYVISNRVLIKAIGLGHDKINNNTEVNITWSNAL